MFSAARKVGGRMCGGPWNRPLRDFGNARLPKRKYRTMKSCYGPINAHAGGSWTLSARRVSLRSPSPTTQRKSAKSWAIPCRRSLSGTVGKPDTTPGAYDLRQVKINAPKRHQVGIIGVV